MNQTIIRMIGKLEEDKKARWSVHLPELLMAYNATRSAVTGYSPYYLLFGRRPQIPVDYLFPTISNPPHHTKMEQSVVAMQKRLKEAFAAARLLTSEEAERQCRYYDRNAGAVALQPGDVVMVRTDAFKGKRKVKDRWEEGGFVIESQLEDWPVYKVKCPPGRGKNKKDYRILHRNRLLLVPPEDVIETQENLDAEAHQPNIPNANLEATAVRVDSTESEGFTPSLLTCQGGDKTSRVWLNGEFRTRPWTQLTEAPEGPTDSLEAEDSDLEPDLSGSKTEGT